MFDLENLIISTLHLINTIINNLSEKIVLLLKLLIFTYQYQRKTKKKKIIIILKYWIMYKSLYK